MYEIVNNKDKSRLSRSIRKGSSTIFDSKEEAAEWMRQMRISDLEYSIVAVKE